MFKVVFVESGLIVMFDNIKTNDEMKKDIFNTDQATIKSSPEFIAFELQKQSTGNIKLKYDILG